METLWEGAWSHWEAESNGSYGGRGYTSHLPTILRILYSEVDNWLNNSLYLYVLGGQPVLCEYIVCVRERLCGQE